MVDPIETLQAGWAAELPDLDTSAMITVAHLNRASILIRRQLEDRMSQLGSSLAEFDVLSALRRQGEPYEMKPSALAKATMLSPSGMTHRLDLLEAAGRIERVPNPKSRRTAPVRLTKPGIEMAEHLAREVVDAEQAMLTVLSATDSKQLNTLLAKVSHGLTM